MERVFNRRIFGRGFYLLLWGYGIYIAMQLFPVSEVIASSGASQLVVGMLIWTGTSEVTSPLYNLLLLVPILVIAAIILGALGYLFMEGLGATGLIGIGVAMAIGLALIPLVIGGSESLFVGLTEQVVIVGGEAPIIVGAE